MFWKNCNRFPIGHLVNCFLFFWLIFFSLIKIHAQADFSISLQIPEAVENETITNMAIEDFINLLHQACHCPVVKNDTNAFIQIILPKPSIARFDKIEDQLNEQGIPVFYYPISNYTWISESKGEQQMLTLETNSFEGIADGLYGLLQEKMGFAFYHPRKMIIPNLNKWPFDENWKWTAHERFNKRGFHLHTMHPIELTEALLDHDFPNGEAMIKEYIDWLARNGQNYFEFNLLNSVDLDKWIPYAKQFVDYGHERGVIMGLDLSLHMIQQKAFMLYKNIPASFKSKEKQVFQNLNVLAKAGWDVYNIEFSSTEFTSGNIGKKLKLQNLITNWAIENDSKIMGRAHVVKKEGEVISYQSEVENGETTVISTKE